MMISCRLGDLCGGATAVISGQEEYVDRVKNFTLELDDFRKLLGITKALGVTDNFREIVDYFKTPAGETPAGFEPVYQFTRDGALLVDLKRNINYGKNGEKRPTGVIFSADSANPYEIKAMRSLIGNITTNPAIIYNTFINNEEVNVGHRFTTREQVMKEIADIVGPGVDISVELNNPFASDSEILEEVQEFKEILGPHRLVVKVPHLGPLNKMNVQDLLDNRLEPRYEEVEVADACRSHDMALMLHEHGYRTNFTLMADPHQVALSLQAKPAFINCFMRNRYWQSEKMQKLLDAYRATDDENYLAVLRQYLIDNYYLSSVKDAEKSLFEVKRLAEKTLRYRGWDPSRDGDGLDEARMALRQLKHANLPDCRLIICSVADEQYWLVDNMLMEPEFADMTDRVVITVSPKYLCGFTSSPVVLNYNRNFIQAAATAK